MRHAIQKHPLGFEYPNLLDDPLGDGEGIGFLLESGRTVALHFAQKFGVRTQVQESDVVQTQSDRGSIHADLLLWLSNGDIQGYLAAQRARGKKVQPHGCFPRAGIAANHVRTSRDISAPHDIIKFGDAGRYAVREVLSHGSRSEGTSPKLKRGRVRVLYSCQ